MEQQDEKAEEVKTTDISKLKRKDPDFKKGIKEKRKENRKRKQQKTRKEMSALKKGENAEIYKEQARKQAQIRYRWKSVNLEDIEFFSPKIFIDLSFDNLHNKFQRSSLLKQLTYCYSIIKREELPPELHIFSFNNDFKTLFEQTEGTKNWKIFKHEEDFTENININTNIETQEEEIKYKKNIELKNLIYLTPDAEETLYTIEHDKTYIIGGLVDNNNFKNHTLEKANKFNIQTFKLPIFEYLSWKPRNSFTINQVFQIILEIGNITREKKDELELETIWKNTLSKILPERKGIKDQTQEVENKDTKNVKE